MNEETLAKKIEDAYTEMRSMIDKLDAINRIVEQFKNNTNDIIDKYISTLEPAKIAEIRENSKKALNEMITDIKKIDQALSDFVVIEHQLGENITSFNTRIHKLEQDLQSNRKSLQDVDTKLIRIIKEAEKNQQTAQKRFYQANQLLKASAEVEKYDELIKLQRENNKMLKELLGKTPGQHQKPLVQKNSGDPFIPKMDQPFKSDKKNHKG
jgi:phosphoglycerate-specific signal transduction histidine kinase